MNGAFDIVVVGGGAAGVAAAVCAARAGCVTLLIDRRAAAGGTGGFSGLTTLCGLFDSAGNWLNDGFSREFAEMLTAAPPRQTGKAWVLPYQPEKFRAAAAALTTATPNLRTRWSTPVAGAVVEDGRITSLNGIRAGAVIDCSGTAEVARLAGAEFLVTDETTQAPAVVFPLRNVGCEMTTPASLSRVLLPLARAGLPPLSFQPAADPDTLTVKFAGRPEQVSRVIEVLRREVGGFENCGTAQTEFTLSRRAGGMIVGRYLLTGADVLAGRKFPDAVARGAWPVEQWDAGGRTRLRYLADGAHYEIPARSLQAAARQNLFMAGKSISADVDAIASARVMGCCLATGAAAGRLAAEWLATPGRI